MEFKKAIEILCKKRDLARKQQFEWERMGENTFVGLTGSENFFGNQHKVTADALDLALTVLRSIPKAGELLSLEQLREMDGKPVWVVCLKKEKYIDPPIGWRILEKSISGNFGVWSGENCLSQRSYGSDWLAYSYPPAHIDRSKWTTKNITDQHPVDQFICSECGAIFEDFSLCKIDEDSGDKEYYEYELKFCPACGRAATKEAWAELERRLSGENP